MFKARGELFLYFLVWDDRNIFTVVNMAQRVHTGFICRSGTDLKVAAKGDQKLFFRHYWHMAQRVHSFVALRYWPKSDHQSKWKGKNFVRAKTIQLLE